MRKITIRTPSGMMVVNGELFTGFKDVDGVAIYEGDELELALYGMGKRPDWGWFGKVAWESGRLVITGIKEKTGYHYKHGEEVRLDELREWQSTEYIPNYGERKCDPTENLVYARKVSTDDRKETT